MATAAMGVLYWLALTSPQTPDTTLPGSKATTHKGLDQGLGPDGRPALGHLNRQHIISDDKSRRKFMVEAVTPLL